MANDLISQSCLCNEASIKTQKDGIWRASQLVNTWRFGENGLPGEGMDALSPFPIPCHMPLFHLAVSELYLFIIDQSSNE